MIEEIYETLAPKSRFFKKVCSICLIPTFDNQLICRYPWYENAYPNLSKQIYKQLLTLGIVVVAPFIGTLYIFWQLINTILIPRVKLKNSGTYLVSSAIHFEEFLNLPNEKLGFWGSIKDLQELRNLNPTYILVPYKRIKPGSNISTNNYHIVDLRALRSKSFFIKYFFVFHLSNLYFTIKLIPILFRFYTTNIAKFADTFYNYKYILGKNLSSTIYLKLLLTDLNAKLEKKANLIFSCEGQSWEMSLLLSGNPQSKFYGNLQIPFRHNDTQIKSYALVKKFKTPEQLNFITVGQKSKEQFIQIIGPQFKVIEAEGQRFISARKNVKPRSEFDAKSISLYLDANVQANKKLIQMIRNSVIEMNSKKLYIYDHPSCVNEKLYPARDSFITINPKAPSRISSINIFSSSTSAVINPKFFGTMVAVYQPISGESPLWGTHKKIFFNDKQTLFMILKNNQIFQESDLDGIVNLDDDFHLWRKFLGTLND